MYSFYLSQFCIDEWTNDEGVHVCTCMPAVLNKQSVNDEGVHICTCIPAVLNTQSPLCVFLAHRCIGPRVMSDHHSTS